MRERTLRHAWYNEGMVQRDQRALASRTRALAAYLRLVCPSSERVPEGVDDLRPASDHRISNIIQECWVVFEARQGESL